MPAVQILNQLLEQMGMECDRKQHREDKRRVRTYTVSAQAKQRNEAVLERRKTRRESPIEAVTPPLSINEIRGGCDIQITPQITESACCCWGSSPEPWAVERIEGAIAHIKGAIGVLIAVPVSELRPLDELETA